METNDNKQILLWENNTKHYDQHLLANVLFSIAVIKSVDVAKDCDDNNKTP